MAKTAREQVGVDLPEPQPVATPQAQDDTPDRPDWLPEQFDSPEAFAKSYGDLRVELQQRGESQKLLEQKIDSLETLIETVTTQQQQPQQQTALPSNYNEQLMNAYEQDPIGTMLFLSQQVAQNTVNETLRSQQPQNAQQAHLQGEMVGAMAQQALGAKYDDWAEYGPRVAAAMEADPWLMPDSALASVNTAADRLESIYKQLKYDDITSGRVQQQPQSFDATRMKEQAQSVTGGIGRPGEPSEVDEKMARLIAAARNSSYSAWRGPA